MSYSPNLLLEYHLRKYLKYSIAFTWHMDTVIPVAAWNDSKKYIYKLKSNSVTFRVVNKNIKYKLNFFVDLFAKTFQIIEISHLNLVTFV